MHVIYAFQCQLAYSPGQSPRGALEGLLADAEGWLRSGPGAVEVMWEGADGNECFSARRVETDPEDADLEWVSSFVAGAGPRATAVSVTVAAVPARFLVRPVPTRALTVPLVPLLVRKYRCHIGGQPVPAEPRLLPAHDVERFVRSQLANPRRALPVVMLAPAAGVADPPVPAGPLQEALLGFAEVVALADSAAASQMNRCLGANRGCPAGAVRLYWPGFDRQADPGRHPIQPVEEGANLGVELLTGFVAAAAARYAPAAPPPAAEEEPLPEAQVAVVEIAPPPDLGAENERLAQECAALRARLAESETALEAARAELVEAGAAAVTERERRRLKAESKRGQMRRGDPRKETIAGALLAAAEDFADILVIYESAVAAAGRSASNKGPTVYRGLEAVAEVGRLYFQARREGRSMGPLDEAFATRIPFKYTANESPTTVSMLGHTRVFRHHGKARQMFRHLTLAPGDRANCVQIFFEFDDDTGRVDVGYCGRHLPISGQPT